MKSVNQAERRKAFSNFLLMFIITIALVVTAVFFGTRVPFAENEKMKEQINAYQNDRLFAEKFSAKISDIQALLDTLGGPNTQTEFINNQVNSLLADLQAMKDKTITGNDNIYAKTLHALYNLQTAKYSLAKSGAQSQDLGRLEQDKAALNQRINSANSQIDYLSGKLGVPSVHY
jgi:Type VI secretion system, TssO